MLQFKLKEKNIQLTTDTLQLIYYRINNMQNSPTGHPVYILSCVKVSWINVIEGS